jgi:hypothetical protein
MCDMELMADGDQRRCSSLHSTKKDPQKNHQGKRTQIILFHSPSKKPNSTSHHAIGLCIIYSKSIRSHPLSAPSSSIGCRIIPLCGDANRDK